MKYIHTKDLDKESIDVDGLQIEVNRKRIKNLYLWVYHTKGEIIINVPVHVSQKRIYTFIQSKLDWLKKTHLRYKNNHEITPEIDIKNNAHYLGKLYPLIVQKSKTKNQVVFQNSTFELQLKDKNTMSNRQKLLIEWYRSELKKIIPSLLSKWERTIQVRVNGWNLRKMSARWGSCDTYERKILFNVELAKKPIACIEYIIVHELIHLLERNHNQKFYKYMDKYLPNWKHLKKELNQKYD